MKLETSCLLFHCSSTAYLCDMLMRRCIGCIAGMVELPCRIYVCAVDCNDCFNLLVSGLLTHGSSVGCFPCLSFFPHSLCFSLGHRFSPPFCTLTCLLWPEVHSFVTSHIQSFSNGIYFICFRFTISIQKYSNAVLGEFSLRRVLIWLSQQFPFA